jgi:hypothetical protein
MRREAGGINVDNEMMTIMKHRTTNVCFVSHFEVVHSALSHPLLSGY